ncbi:MAG: magnesium transporter [Planctomycetota bacterium]|jgi:magnesium transporter
MVTASFVASGDAVKLVGAHQRPARSSPGADAKHAGSPECSPGPRGQDRILLAEMTPDRQQQPTFRDFRDLLAESPERALSLIEAVHNADIANWLRDVTEEDAWIVFRSLSVEDQAEVLEYGDEGLRHTMIQRLNAISLTPLIEELPSDVAVDILAEASRDVSSEVLDQISIETARELRELIAYPPESAGGVMTTDYVSIAIGSRIGDAIKLFRKDEEAEDSIGVFVVDTNNHPVGYLSDRALLSTPIHTTVEDVMVEAFSINAHVDQEEASRMIAHYNLFALGVTELSGELVGVVSAEDAAEIYEEEVDEDILKLVGTAPGEQEQTRLPVLVRVRQRLPLMAVTVMGGLLSAWILEYFLRDSAGGTSANAAILRFLPLIIGLAGNVGIQSSTILVRGFATGEVEPERELRVLYSEVSVGTWIGVLCGSATTLVAAWMESTPFGLAVGTAVFVAVSWAAVLGCVIPMGCRRLGIDPAIVAGPFLICLSDVSGSAIYILVARALIPLG